MRQCRVPPGYATNVNSHAKNTAFGMKMQSGSSLITLFCLVLRAGVERGTGAGIDRAWKGERAGEDVGGEGRGGGNGGSSQACKKREKASFQD